MTWTCDDTRDALSRGQVPRGDVANAHLSGCPACREVVVGDGELGRRLGALRTLAVDHRSSESLPPALAQALGAEHQLLDWGRSLSTRWRRGIAVAIALAPVAFNVVFKARADWDVYPAVRLHGIAAVYAVVVAVAVWLASWPVHRRPPRHRWVAVAFALLVPVLVAATAPAHQDHPASLAGSGTDFWPAALGCFLYGTVLALPVMAMWGWLDRWQGRDPGVALLVGGLGGAVAAFLLHVHCPVTDGAHILFGHALVGGFLVPFAVLASRALRRGGA